MAESAKAKKAPQELTEKQQRFRRLAAQVTSERASRTKPRFRLMRVETVIRAIMTQSIQISASIENPVEKRKREFYQETPVRQTARHT